MNYSAGISMTLISFSLLAGEADVIDASIEYDAKNSCKLTARLKHEDEGWDHYSDRWEVLTSSRGEIAARELAHPHANEQPFRIRDYKSLLQ